jgi:hypothetical protein
MAGERHNAGVHHGEGQPGSDRSDSDTKYCPGCSGRPLIATSHRLTLTLEPAPIDAPPADADAAASFDVPFAIFHPPRA